MRNKRSAHGEPSVGDETLVYHQKQGWGGLGGLPRSITVLATVAILGQLEEVTK